MTKEAQARESIVLIKSVEKTGWGAGSTIPPLGTVNALKTEFTSHVDSSDIPGISPAAKRSEPFLGAFWIAIGNTELSISSDYDKGEWSFFNKKARATRGIPKYSGSMSVTKLLDDPRWEIMSAGKWDAEYLLPQEGNYYPRYEVWIMEYPDSKDYFVTKCKHLTKLHGVTFDSLEKAFSGAFSFSLPVSIIEKSEFVNWENGKVLATDFALSETEVVIPAGEIIDIDMTPKAINTRLAFNNTTGALAEFRITGIDITGEFVEEYVSLADTEKWITGIYVHGSFKITNLNLLVAIPAGLEIYPVDHKITSPYNDWPV